MKSQKYQECDEETKCTQLPFNSQETAKIENSPIYTRYKKWLKDNGVLIDPRLRYPSYFGPPQKGVIGVSAQKGIQKKRGVIAVPYHLLITVDKVKEDMDLFEIVKDNLAYFKTDDDSALKLLILYVSSQLIKGEKSFYYPYFSISTQQYLSGWGNKSILMLEQKYVIGSMKDQKEQMQLQFMSFLRIFRRYDKIFPQSISNSEFKVIFQKAYIFITTRAFGWSLPSISLIPLADSLNHSNIRYVNHFLMSLDQQRKPYPEITEQSNGYKKYGKQVNLAILKDQYLNLKQEELAQLRKQKKSKPLKFIEKHAEILNESQKLLGIQGSKLKVKNKSQVRNKQYHILYQQYKAGIHKLRNLHFYQSSCDEDNDTDEDQVFDREMERQKFMIYDKQRVIDESNKKKEVSKFFKFYLDSASQEQSEEQNKQKPTKQEKQRKEIQNKKLKEDLQEKLLKQDDSSEISSEDTEEDQQQIWDWTNKANHKKTYFIMSTKQIIKQNQQIYNFYGRRSNKFLLVGYNFIMQDNIYDSYWLSLRLDAKLAKSSPGKLLSNDGKKDDGLRSRPFKLKRFLINQDLINICRSYVILWSKVESINCRLTIPFDQQIQTKTLELYGDIIKQLLKEYSTSFQEDEQQQQENENLKYEERTSIALRKEHKKILKGQEALVNKCLQWIKKWQPKGPQKIEEAEMKLVRRVKSYLISLEQAVSL